MPENPNLVFHPSDSTTETAAKLNALARFVGAAPASTDDAQPAPIDEAANPAPTALL